MKVTLKVLVDVDLHAWAAEYGTGETAAEVREDVRDYFRTHIQGAPAVEGVGLTVTVR